MTLFGRIRASAAKPLTVAATVMGLTACALLASAAPASASHSQVALFEEPSIEAVNPAQSAGYIEQQMQWMHNLGVGTLRVGIDWSAIAPDPNSRTQPSFDASNPNAYPAGAWAPYDQLINLAHSYGMQVDAIIGGPAPLWATQPNPPGCGTVGGSPVCFSNVWYPSVSDYSQFARAVASRYGSVHFWEIWNEANWGPALAPQVVNGALVGASIYRSLLNAAYSALASAGHGRDTIVAGNYSQYASAVLNATATSAPITFTRDLYCVNSSYKPLRGASARAVGCPTTKAATRRFRSSNPGLFKLSSFGVHPYQVFNPPTKPDFPSPTAVEYAEIPNLVTTLDRAQRAYGSRKRLSIYNTEYGYQTSPPAPSSPNPSQATAATWLNQAEYIAWKNPRIGSYDQYELQDLSWFRTGILNADWSPKATYYAYRMPIWLPSGVQRRGKTEVWGAARPAHFASASQRTAYIQFASGSSGQFRNVKAVRVNGNGYFDVRVKFPSSGQVRIAWQYPPGASNLFNSLGASQTWIYSRTANVTVG